MSSSHLSTSMDPSALRALSPEQQERLTDVLDGYLRALDDGVQPSAESLIAAHPDLADALRAYLDGLDQLHGMAAGFRTIEPPAESADGPDVGFDRGRLGDFVLGREVGRGGMGIVYEAQQLSLNRRVALKVLPFAAVFDTTQIARFKNEAQAAAQLNHPHIVPIYAVGMDRGVHYYAMQYIEGQPLDQAIAQLRENQQGAAWSAAIFAGGVQEDPAATEAEAPSLRRSLLSAGAYNRRAYIHTVIRLGIQAAEALHAAHEYGIVHRDVKPSNLLLDHEGKLWITDFGLARFQSDGTLTRSGDVVGTRRYMSPEQASGDAAMVDHRTDIYALAATLFELLTVQTAVAGPAAVDAWPHGPQEPPRLRRINPDIPKDLETVVRKAMAKDREERYTTARQLADDLRRVLAGKPTVAKPPTILERAGKWMRRHLQLVAAAVGLTLLLGAASGLGAVLFARKSMEAEGNYQRAERNLAAAQDVVDRFGSQLAEYLADVPGAAQVRRDLLAETIGYYRAFAEQAGHDPQLRSKLALTYSKIAELEQENGSGDAALVAHETARDLTAQLVAEEPRNRSYRRNLGICWNNLARALAARGRVDEAFQAYDEALRTQSQLADENDDDSQYLSDLAGSYNNLGLLQAQTGGSAAAERSFREAIRLHGSLATSQSQDATHHRSLAASCNNLAGLFVKQDVDRAVPLFHNAIHHLNQAVAARPADLTCRSELAVSYSNLASAQAQRGEYADAEATYQQAIDIQTQLVRSATERRSFRRDLSISLNNQGLLWSKLGQPDAAERVFHRALELQEALLVQDPDDIVLHSGIAGVYNNLGIAHEEQDRVQDAAAAFSQAVEHQRVAFERASTVERYRTFLSKHYFNYGRVLRKLGQAEQAIKAATARRELWPHDPTHLLAVAEEFALASDLLSAESSTTVTKEQAVTLALDTLEQAIDQGLIVPADFDTNERFAAIRTNQRFIDLMEK